MEISDWRPFVKKTLQGFFAVTTPSGLKINGLTLHQQGESRWLGMPNQKFTKADGTVSYTPIIEFVSRDVRDRFRDQVRTAIDEQILAAAGGGQLARAARP